MTAETPKVAAVPLPQRIYNRLKRQVAGAGLPEFSVNSALGRDGSSLFARAGGAPLSRGVPGLYSVAGYKKVLDASWQSVAEVAKDNWVLDRREASAAAGVEQLREQVLQLYFADYIRQWDGFLADVRLVPLTSMDGAARVVVRLTAQAIFPNCPRYIPDLAHGTPSAFAVPPGAASPAPAWKSRDYTAPILPADDPHR